MNKGKARTRKNQLRVHYDCPNDGPDVGIDVGLDSAIEIAIKPFGYRRWASGYEMETGIRDLAFDKKENN